MQLAFLDSDIALGAHVSQVMADAGHKVTHYPDTNSMLRGLQVNSFDLLLLDWTLDSSGPEVLRWIQIHLDPAPPAIMISARAGEADIVAGLSSGADDYLLKPMQDNVLRARVEALLRRVYGGRAKRTVESFGEYAFNTKDRSVIMNNARVATTAKEFDLALLLFRNLNRPLSRNYIIEAVWGRRVDPTSRTLDAHISQVRIRLGLRPENGFRLSSVYSFGYRLEQTSAQIA